MVLLSLEYVLFGTVMAMLLAIKLRALELLAVKLLLCLDNAEHL